MSNYNKTENGNEIGLVVICFVCGIGFFTAYKEYFVVGTILAIIVLIAGKLLFAHQRGDDLVSVFTRRSTMVLLVGLLAFSLVIWGRSQYPDDFAPALKNFLQTGGLVSIWLGIFLGGLVLPVSARLPSSSRAIDVFVWQADRYWLEFLLVFFGYIVGSSLLFSIS